MKAPHQMIVKPSGQIPDEFENKVVEELKKISVYFFLDNISFQMN